MTSPRREQVDPEVSGYFHCISRCVRRAYLCGVDKYSGRSFEHRKEWVRNRLAKLLGSFAIDCLGYAVMSNHLHTVLRTKPDVARRWDATEVLRRWFTLFPKRKDGVEIPIDILIEANVGNEDLVNKLRLRLSDLSWFNRCLNEHVARRANKEDDCTGRFWEGRFKSPALRSLSAVLACCVYVDLNPIRAKIARTSESSDFTSVQQRIKALLGSGKRNCANLPYLIEHCEISGLSEQEYIRLVDETGRCLVEGKDSVSQYCLPILARLQLKAEGWLLNAKSEGTIFRRFIGPVESLRELALKHGRQWFQGINAARQVFV